jgi:formamidopyrimidine-DNA glycosylase
MPEVPEITILSQYLKSKLKGRILKSIDIISGKYIKSNIKGIDYLCSNKSFIINDINSKGKLLYLSLKNIMDSEETIYITSHLGLSGEWTFHKRDSDRVRINICNKNNSKTYTLCYNDSLNFGNIELTNSSDILEEKLNNLAPDALKYIFSDTEFIEIVNKYKKVSQNRKKQLIYTVLIKQNMKDGILSGLGNYLIPEILYDAKISPHREIGSLTDIELIKISKSIKYMTKLSYYNNNSKYLSKFNNFLKKHKKHIDDDKYPIYHPQIKLKNNDVFLFKVYQKNKDPYENNVIKDKSINKGRTVHWVSEIQK